MGLKPQDGKYFIDFFGRGLSGSVHGEKSKIARFSLNSFHLNDVNVANPDSAAISFARKYKERSGSVGGELLKRFNIVMDYKNRRVIFKKNAYFKNEFAYNKSGIVLAQDGVRIVKEVNDLAQIINSHRQRDKLNLTVLENYEFILKPAFRIVELRSNSPAEKAGLKIGDIIVSVNNKKVSRLKMQDINTIFRGKTGKRIN